jgi:hypothetical protein
VDKEIEMITQVEAAKVKTLFDRMESGDLTIPRADIQWALDLIRRERLVLPADLVQRFKNGGFAVSGIRTSKRLMPRQ